MEFMDLVIIGAGGHGRVVLDILRAAGNHNPVGFIDANTALGESSISQLPVIGAPNQLPRLKQKKVRGAIVAIGDNRTRMRYMQMLDELGFELIQAIHPAASVAASASLGRNAVVCAGGIVCADVRLDDCVIVNTGAVVDHECVIRAGAHICPGAVLAGRVNVAEEAFVGLGARVLQCLSVGQGAVVGAGAVVIADVPAGATVVGVPARVIKASSAQAA
jgi:UDP-perosamine 4-acetyltransferase